MLLNIIQELLIWTWNLSYAVLCVYMCGRDFDGTQNSQYHHLRPTIWDVSFIIVLQPLNILTRTGDAKCNGNSNCDKTCRLRSSTTGVSNSVLPHRIVTLGIFLKTSAPFVCRTWGKLLSSVLHGIQTTVILISWCSRVSVNNFSC